MPPKVMAKQSWSAKNYTEKPKSSLLSRITTWLVPFVFTAPNQTAFTVKAGNKDMGLDGSTVTSTAANYSTSELSLKKKYRLLGCYC